MKYSNRQEKNKYYRFRKDDGHDTSDCFDLKKNIETLIQRGTSTYMLTKGNDVLLVKALWTKEARDQGHHHAYQIMLILIWRTNVVDNLAIRGRH